MTLTLAKLYKTATIDEAIEGYQVGDIVSVKFAGKGSFGGFNFLIAAEYLNRVPVVVSEFALKDFVL